MSLYDETKLTLSATDVLAPTTMKNAAKCDTSCELQNPVSHQNFERILHFPLGSMSVGVSVHPHDSFHSLNGMWSSRFCDFGYKHLDEITPCRLLIFPENVFSTRRPKFFGTFHSRISDICFYSKSEMWFVDNPIGPPIRQEYPLNLSI